MKLTLIGRPGKVTPHDTYVSFPMSGPPPASLPKDVPPPPRGAPALVWTVWLGLKQWNRVKGSVHHPDEKLILDGYPCLKGDEHILVVQGCQSLLQMRAKKDAQRAAVGAARE